MAFRHGEVRHVFAVRQRLRPDAAAVVAGLERRGIAVEILSGDREPAVGTPRKRSGFTSGAQA